MFAKKENTNVKFTTILSAGCDLQGDFSAEESVRIDGNVNGNVKVDGMLVLGSSGKISGDIAAKSVLLGGEVLGNVIAPEKAELTETAKVLGDISTKTIVIDEHAVFQGKCNMNDFQTTEELFSKREVEIKEKILEVLKKDAEESRLENERSIEPGQFIEPGQKE